MDPAPVLGTKFFEGFKHHTTEVGPHLSSLAQPWSLYPVPNQW